VDDKEGPGGERGQDGTEYLDTARLTAVAESFGITLTEPELQRLGIYARALVEANRRLNLSRLTGPEELAVAHIGDSFACLWGRPDGAAGRPPRWVDVGTGAGMPGLAVAVLHPDWRLTLVDSVGKKVSFVSAVIQAMGLDHAVALQARAEDLGRDPDHREAYDVALARALAPMPTLAEYLLPLVRIGGRVLALKGADAEAELAEAAAAIGTLGGAVVGLRPYSLPGLDRTRHLVVIEKRRPTPAAYPRRAGLPGRSPIRGDG
jgi:16S rRNA (guanine527-N7)-methyltransferase